MTGRTWKKGDRVQDTWGNKGTVWLVPRPGDIFVRWDSGQDIAHPNLPNPPEELYELPIVERLAELEHD